MSRDSSRFSCAQSDAHRTGLFADKARRNWKANTRMPSLLAAGLVACIVTVAPRAQAALGDGFAVGSGRLKLGVDLNLRVDDEAGAGFTSSSQQNATDLIGLVQGKFALSLKTDSVFVDFGGGIGWNQYFGLANANEAKHIGDLSFLSANARGEIDVNKDRPVGLEITENLFRSDQSSNPVFGLGVIALSNVTKLRVHFRPGGGAMEFGISGQFDAGAYSPQILGSTAVSTTGCNAANASADPSCTAEFDSYMIHGGLDALWRIFPKTGITAEVNAAAQQYIASATQASIGSVSAVPVVADLGFGTLLTARFAFSLKIGYQGIFFQPTSSELSADGPITNYQSFMGQVELGYKFNEALFARLGASRGATPVAGRFHYFDDNRIYLEAQYRATSFLSFHLMGTTDFLGFGDVVALNADGTVDTMGGSQVSQAARQDQSYGVVVSGDWAATAWLHVVAGFIFSARNSVANDGLDGLSTNSSYNRAIGNVGVTTFF